jgi:radical SAM protein with 4Fe4S-binding SPASM domain
MMEAGTYTEFSARLHRTVLEQRIPVNVTVEISRRCPLACSHCYNNLPMADVAARRGELTTEEHYLLLDQLAEAGCLWLLYTGGEILARRDFLDIYTYAKKKGFIITLFTNGTLVTPKVADHLVEYRPFAIEVTLYGRTRETYERLTRVPGSFDRCLEGIRLLKERGLPLTLKTVAVTVNKHEIWGMKEFAEEELGLPFRFDGMMTPRIDCSQSPLEVRLSPAEIVELDLLDPARVKEWGDFSCESIGPQQRTGKEDDVYHCGGGVNSFSVDPSGKMSICVLSHRDTYDLRTGTFEEGWKHFLGGVRERKITRVTKCTACQLKSVCGMCPANAELENGDPESPVDFLCHTAHLRALTMGWKVPPHGECEYCEGGERREVVVRSAELIRKGTSASAPNLPVMLPALGGAASHVGCSGGCGSCASR